MADSNFSDLRPAIVVSRWNELITNALLEGARDTLRGMGVPEPCVIHVPGAWEIPPVCAALIEADHANVIVALGCILQGQTTHAQLLASDVSRALMDLQVKNGVAIGWGILTPDDAHQALDRCGLKHGNKGREAAASAVETAQVLRSLRSS